MDPSGPTAILADILAHPDVVDTGSPECLDGDHALNLGRELFEVVEFFFHIGSDAVHKLPLQYP